MDTGQVSIRDIHSLMDMLQSIDVGLVVIDKDYKVSLWNNFMENHSGLKPSIVSNKSMFDFFPYISKSWFKRKVETVITLQTRTFSVWEQNPYLFKFKSYHPITGQTEFMYQNVTFMPLVSTDGSVDKIGIIIYDVTDIAINRLELQKAYRELQTISRTDALTELNNRRYWEECLGREFLRCKRSNNPGALIMLDIDHFKKVNDTYGHPTGDAVIRETGLIIRKLGRLTDIPGRYGGEEFAVLLNDTTEENAHVYAERLRKEIESQHITFDGKDVHWTISIGIAGFNASMKSHKEWIEAADQALYSAKRNGRNQAVILKKAS
jgi:diguanylate cyclase (GGDEF)-like protein